MAVGDPNVFLVKVDEAGYFYVRLNDDGESVSATRVLSEALHLGYREADVLCQNLRARGYNAIVSDRFGQPVTETVLSVEDQEASDWKLLALISAGESSAEIASRFGIGLSELNARLEAAAFRFEKINDSIRSFVQGKRSLVLKNEEAHAEHILNQKNSSRRQG